MKTLSPYQVEIHKQYTTTTSNIIIEAGPGSGKSTTILDLLKLTPKHKRCILVAFNKSIADELKTKVPGNVKVSTIHSLAYSVLRQNFCRNFKVTEYKNFILGKKTLDLSHFVGKKAYAYLFMISNIIDLSRLNLCKTREDISAVCEKYNISIINGELDDVMKMIDVLDKYNNSDGREFMIDFTDMLWLAYSKVKPEHFPKYSVTFCDELQDLNPLQKEIVERCISTNGRFVGVGDFRQAIYSFMGANIESFKSFVNRPNTITLPLSVTYRCSKKVTEEANGIFPGLESFEANQEGSVRFGELKEVKEGDFIICRNNLPLIKAFIEMLKLGVRASILGKDFGQNLITIIDKLAKFDDYQKGVETMLKQKEEQLREKGIKNPKGTSNYGALVEKLDIIKILRKEFGTFVKLEQEISRIFNDKTSGGVILCTGHKSKGLEADRVFFLHPQLIPSKYAETEMELYQERCLRYVITTRARLELIYVI
jgi:DNA helicase-2/ATP-dependent DNA helicase PcrA